MQRILCNFAIWSNKVVRQPFEAQKRAGTEAWVHLFITELKLKKKKLSFKVAGHSFQVPMPDSP